MDQDEDIYTRIIDSQEHFQVRLTINRFRGTEYIHIRKYYQDFDETWKPSSDGIAMPLTITNTQELFSGLVEILSLAESKEIINIHFKELLEDIFQ